jgi:hypothetical protein
MTSEKWCPDPLALGIGARAGPGGRGWDAGRPALLFSSDQRITQHVVSKLMRQNTDVRLPVPAGFV